uniref:NADH-ubiquinone oxidoreductase chain 6 n=1 Tax=Rieppeleon kerstenii TaxID=338557 RepID=D6RS33_9SAUR|nr:NADH dehydrogenase subunit 6 [Rieppeleon kerstenii]
MVYVLMLCFFFVFMVGVASNPSPYFGSAALVLASVFGAGILAGFSSTYISLVVVLVYLGGMLVVFVYSVAMSSDMYPEAWGGRSVILYVLGFSGYLVCLWLCVADGLFLDCVVHWGVLFEDIVVDWGGVVLLWGGGGWGFLILGVGLLLTLFVVLYLVRGWCLGSIRH